MVKVLKRSLPPVPLPFINWYHIRRNDRSWFHFSSVHHFSPKHKAIIGVIFQQVWMVVGRRGYPVDHHDCCHWYCQHLDCPLLLESFPELTIATKKNPLRNDIFVAIVDYLQAFWTHKMEVLWIMELFHMEPVFDRVQNDMGCAYTWCTNIVTEMWGTEIDWHSYEASQEDLSNWVKQLTYLNQYHLHFYRMIPQGFRVRFYSTIPRDVGEQT